MSLSSSSSNPSFKNKLRALVVDDQQLYRTLLTAQLKKLGVECEEADDGKVAVDLFAAGSQFHVIFMDRNMPVMDGLEATRRIRAMGANTRIVAVTSETEEEKKQEFMNAGINEIYGKPLKKPDLLQVLKNADDSF